MALRLRRGVLITLEGGEGSGKSTQAAALAAYLRDEGYDVRLTQEPDGTDLGRLIKRIFEREAGDESAVASGTAELFLFEAARAQHVEAVIRGALELRQVVLCDRFTDSTLAYQGYGRGLSLDHIRACNHMATGGLAPDLTLLLDIEPRLGLARKETEPSRDSIGQESLAFHQRVREGYLALAQREPARIAVIDASLPAEAVAKAVRERADRLLQHIL